MLAVGWGWCQILRQKSESTTPTQTQTAACSPLGTRRTIERPEIFPGTARWRPIKPSKRRHMCSRSRISTKNRERRACSKQHTHACTYGENAFSLGWTLSQIKSKITIQGLQVLFLYVHFLTRFFCARAFVPAFFELNALETRARRVHLA